MSRSHPIPSPSSHPFVGWDNTLTYRSPLKGKGGLPSPINVCQIHKDGRHPGPRSMALVHRMD